MSLGGVIKCRTFSFVTDGTVKGTQFIVDGKPLEGVRVCYVRFEAEHGTVGVTMENQGDGNEVNYKVIKFKDENGADKSG